MKITDQDPSTADMLGEIRALRAEVAELRKPVLDGTAVETIITAVVASINDVPATGKHKAAA